MSEATPYSELLAFLNSCADPCENTHEGLVRYEDTGILAATHRPLVSSHSLFFEGIHFDLSYTPLHYLGYKLVSLCLPKLYAKHAIPTQIQLSFALSNRFQLVELRAFFKGVQEACETYGIRIMRGGALTTSRTGLCVGVQCTGPIREEMPTDTHPQAQDVLCVTNTLAAPYLALLLLEREKEIHAAHPAINPNFEGQKDLLQSFFYPPNAQSVLSLCYETQLPMKAITPLLDGLANALFRLCHTYQLGVTLYEEKLPIPKELKDFAHSFPIDTTLCALSGGEETALLVTVSAADFLHNPAAPSLYPIGVLERKEKGKKIKTKAGNYHDLKAQQWKEG